MKTIIYFTIGFWCSMHLYAQDFSLKQQQRLEKFGLNYAYLIEQSETNEEQLREILDMDRKRKNSLIIGSTFVGLGLVMLTGASLIYSQDSGCDDTDFCENMGAALLGGGLMALGTMEISVSIPLLANSYLKKRKRNKMIREIQWQNPVPLQLQ
ncbi:MAG: hypothetical protein ACTHOM_00530 [Allomuricauda sp.]